MATILSFRTADREARAAQAEAQPCENPARSAELIFFPGVRYERAEAAPEPRQRRSRRTKIRELIDMMD